MSNDCTVCGESIATMPASACGPRDDRNCACCGKSMEEVSGETDEEE